MTSDGKATATAIMLDQSRHTDNIAAVRKAGSAEPPLTIVMIAGEMSGDHLGGKLMEAITAQSSRTVSYTGVGGELMAAQGLQSLFPMEEVAVMGVGAIARRLPQLIKRVYQCVDAALAAKPDVVIIVDAPEFTHPIAKRIKRRAPHIPILDYVSPSVWAWRSGRARKMSRYIDHILALLPFEPQVHEQLGGPACSYVGHPLLERAPWIASLATEPLIKELGIAADKQVIVVLPGSRSSEVARLMEPFGKTIAQLSDQGLALEVIIPAVRSRQAQIEHHLASWPLRPHLVFGEEAKFQAFKLADVALAASGTVTLELAVAGTPMVVGYRVGAITYQIMRRLITARSAVLANLILTKNAFPEYLHDTCFAEHLAPALEKILKDTPERRAQLAALAQIQSSMVVPGGNPSSTAANIVLKYAKQAK